MSIINLIPTKLLPNPQNNACMTCPLANWAQIGNKAMCHCSKMYMFTWGNNSNLNKEFEQEGVSLCDGNPTYKPEENNNKNS